jgi:hypothetical protein
LSAPAPGCDVPLHKSLKLAPDLEFRVSNPTF